MLRADDALRARQAPDSIRGAIRTSDGRMDSRGALRIA